MSGYRSIDAFAICEIRSQQDPKHNHIRHCNKERIEFSPVIEAVHIKQIGESYLYETG